MYDHDDIGPRPFPPNSHSAREYRYREAERLYAAASVADTRGNHKEAEGLRLRAYNLTTFSGNR